MADENKKFPNGWGNDEDEDDYAFNNDEDSAWGSGSSPFKKKEHESPSDVSNNSDNAPIQKSPVNELRRSPDIPAPVPSVTPTNNPGYIIQKRKTSPVLIIIIVILVLIIGILGGMFFMMSSDNRSDDPSSIPVSDVEKTTNSEEAPTESETKTTTAEKTTETTTTTSATTTELTEKNSKTLTTYHESDISKYPQYIKAAENDRDSDLADYFALIDINDDNIPELFLTDMDGRIYAIYTTIGNDYTELQRVGGSGRDWITLYIDGCISHGSSLGMDGGYTDYEYTGGTELTVIKSYSLQEYNGVPDSHGGEASLSVSSLANYVTQESKTNDNYTTYDTSAATADFYFNDNQFGYGGTIVTENDPLNLRTAPSSDAEVIIQMPKGADVGIFGYNNDWYYVCYTENGITYYGYASRHFIAGSDI